MMHSSSNRETDRLVRSAYGMAATSQPLATAAAVDVLGDGGSAADAAIAANAMLGLVEPTGCGVGGDLFAIIWDPNKETLLGLNASGRAPANLEADSVRAALDGADKIPTEGPWCVTVPGCVDGWYELHARFGCLEMPRLLAPASHAAREGFRLTPVIAREWAHDVERIRNAGYLLGGAEEYLRTFAPSGRAPKPGEKHANPGIAETLDAVAAGGRDAFYKGRIADAMAGAVARLGGTLTPDDFAMHRSQWVEPVSARYRGVDVFELPENDQGVTALQMLRLLDGVPLREWGFGSADALHMMTECKKLAFEDRARFIADPAVAGSRTQALLSEERIQAMRSRIRIDSALTCAEARLPVLEHGDTCYLTTADRNGMMVSFIQSNFLKTGSGIVPRGLGFGLQNRGALFSLHPSHLNVLAPGKRPFHTIIPAFALRDGRPLLSFGVMGGAMQPQGHVQILANLLDFDMNVTVAGRAPRWRHVGSSRPTGFLSGEAGALLCEPGFEDGVLEDLRGRGHRVEVKDAPGHFGGYQAIAVDPESGDYVGATEERKDGVVRGI